MIENIQEVSLDDFNVEEEGSGFWTFDEVCDKCGKQITRAGLFAQNSIPDFQRRSLCIDCIGIFSFGKSSES